MADKRTLRNGTSATEVIRTVILTVIFIAAIPLVILSILYAIDLKRELELVRLDTTNVAADVNQQKKIAERQLALSRQQLEISQSLLDIAQQQLETTEIIASTAESSDAKLTRSLRIQGELLDVSRATLQQAQEINRKTPDASQVNTLLGQ